MLYDKHVPADPLLAPAFADMPPGQPQLLAGWLAEALRGPARTAGSNGLRQVIGATSADFGEEQRARWVVLATAAADDAKLPGDPAFRSALAACLDWVSRSALATTPGDTSEAAPVPRWQWDPAGRRLRARPARPLTMPDLRLCSCQGRMRRCASMPISSRCFVSTTASR